MTPIKQTKEKKCEGGDWYEGLFGVGAPLGPTIAEHAAHEAEIRRQREEVEKEEDFSDQRYDRRLGIDGER